MSCSNRQSIFDMKPDEARPRPACSWLFQYPMEIPGVATMTFLRTAFKTRNARSAVSR